MRCLPRHQPTHTNKTSSRAMAKYTRRRKWHGRAGLQGEIIPSRERFKRRPWNGTQHHLKSETSLNRGLLRGPFHVSNGQALQHSGAELFTTEVLGVLALKVSSQAAILKIRRARDISTPTLRMAWAIQRSRSSHPSLRRVLLFLHARPSLPCSKHRRCAVSPGMVCDGPIPSKETREKRNDNFRQTPLARIPARPRRGEGPSRTARSASSSMLPSKTPRWHNGVVSLLFLLLLLLFFFFFMFSGSALMSRASTGVLKTIPPKKRPSA